MTGFWRGSCGSLKGPHDRGAPGEPPERRFALIPQSVVSASNGRRWEVEPGGWMGFAERGYAIEGSV